MNHLLRLLCFVLVAKPLALLVLGVNARGRDRLASVQPAIVVANHNSHLDTLVLMTLFPLRLLRKIRPVAAMDYFLRNRLLAWFATRIVGIVPIPRQTTRVREDPLATCCEALDRGEVLILYPEGTRGAPEQIASFKTGIAHLAKRRPDVPVIPVFMHGLGKALPKGDWVLVPFFCDVVVGEKLIWTGSRGDFMAGLDDAMQALAAQVHCPPWD